MRLWVFGCFVNNEGEHLSTGKCGRSELDITALATFVSTGELQGLHSKLVFLGKAILSPSPKIFIILIKVWPRLKFFAWCGLTRCGGRYSSSSGKPLRKICLNMHFLT